ncbi:hypothetical protein PYJP_06880 [Pyrofollis japonicus]|uniref:zinc ribbon domain-containing protein n=1 Tax=Pyrofollis japonicus TaxID=3060460 RepID=UPI00295B0CE0|nr:zinc ribbon domain-containing protein [Pyrofollis japonicus]BEP17336.1 hypothetical protein PYJP_06880 [Pyrofollis japonicus]
MASTEAVLESPEAKLTAATALAAGVDGVDIVVAAHEGLVYNVEAKNPELELYAEELASLSVSYLEAPPSRALNAKPSIIVASHMDRALLIANIGGGYTLAALGDPRAISSLIEPLSRIINGTPLRCPKCGANVEVFTQTCPRCGRRVPFGIASCPFCGADLSLKTCPNCGTSLRLVENRLEVVEKPETVEVAATAPSEERARAEEKPLRPIPPKIGVSVASLGAAIYFILVYGFKLPMLESTIAGIVPIAISYILGLARRL